MTKLKVRRLKWKKKKKNLKIRGAVLDFCLDFILSERQGW